MEGLGTRLYILASVTGEALGVVGVAQCRHHPPLNEISTGTALGPKEDVVVFTAVVVITSHEVATRGQHTIADWWGGGGGGRRREEGRGKEGGRKGGREGRGEGGCERFSSWPINLNLLFDLI